MQAPASATAFGVGAAQAIADEAVDATGLQANAPVRQMVSEALQLTADCLRAPMDASSLVSAGARLGTYAVAESLKDEAPGLSQLSSLSSVVGSSHSTPSFRNISWKKTIYKATGASLGASAGMSARLVADPDSSTQEIISAARLGGSFGSSAGQATDGRINDNSWGLTANLAIDTAAQAATASAMYGLADNTADADINSVLHYAQSIKVSREIDLSKKLCASQHGLVGSSTTEIPMPPEECNRLYAQSSIGNIQIFFASQEAIQREAKAQLLHRLEIDPDLIPDKPSEGVQAFLDALSYADKGSGS